MPSKKCHSLSTKAEKNDQKLGPESLYKGKARYDIFGQLQLYKHWGRSESIGTTISYMQPMQTSKTITNSYLVFMNC